MLARMWGNWITHTLLVEMQNGTATTLENSSGVSKNTKHATNIWLSVWYSWHSSQRNEELCSPKACTRMFIAALCIIAENWEHRCSSTGEWLNKLWYNHAL